MTLAQLLGEFVAVGLGEIDERASLQRRVDRKYLLTASLLRRLLEDLRVDHEALEIDGVREFAYESVYFDDPSLALFGAHVEGRTPRAKVRTRLYRDTQRCQLEVKVRRGDGEMDKHQRDVDLGEHGRLGGEGRDFVAGVLEDLPGAPRADELRPTLTTAFRRGTLVAVEGPERITVDAGVRLAAHDGRARCLRDDLLLVETKTRDGDGRLDRLLHDAGVEAQSVSKYRLGVGLLLADDPDPPLGARRDTALTAC